jgi:hypothetical protein
MSTPNFRDIIKAFHALSPAEQDSLLRDVYNFSPDMKALLTNRLTGSADFSTMIAKMERETIGKIYRKGMPGTPNGNKVNEIIRAAKAAEAPLETMLQFEQLAYRGFIEYLNEFGGGPDNFDDMACRHLEAYLQLVTSGIRDEQEREAMYEKIRRYLRKKDNMVTDYTDAVFEDETGRSVR